MGEGWKRAVAAAKATQMRRARPYPTKEAWRAHYDRIGATAVEKLKELQGEGDTEAQHGVADMILCELLRELGYGNVVDEYEKIDKWYA